MGIIVLAVAVLPMLGVGGMQLYRAETPGPVKDTKLTPRITETAKALWYVYLAFTTLCVLGYLFAGMNWFDALCHAFATVAIGGFSTHDASLGYFNSAAVNLVAVVFMFVAGVNFSLHFFTWRYLTVRHYLENPEFRAYVFVLVAVSVLVIAGLFWTGTYTDPRDGINNGLLQAVSIATTTGFTTDRISFLARGFAGVAGFREFYRRVRRFDGWRDQGRTLPADLQAGRTRNRTAGAPECGDPCKTRPAGGTGAGRSTRYGASSPST